jgi:hypothetical protein
MHLLVANYMERANKKAGDYQPNPNGLYEVGVLQYLNAKFTRKLEHGCLIKILYDGLPSLPASDYKIVFMTRNEDEVRASCDRVMAYNMESCGENYDRLKAEEETRTHALPFYCLRPHSSQDVHHVLGICRQRRDFDLIKVDYGDVIRDPEKEFNRLADLGIPIDPMKSAKTIDKKLHRCRS